MSRARLAVPIALSSLALTLCPAAFAADYTVNSTLDLPALKPNAHVCQTALPGVCTIRAAIEAANASGPSTVVIPAGDYRITRPPGPQLTQAVVLGTDPANGYLAITGSVTAIGAGADKTTIDGNGLDRVFGVRLSAKATIEDMTITGGDPVLRDTVLGNLDIALGGGILNFGKLALARVAIVDNHADGGGGMFTAPGGIFAILDSLIADNSAVEGGGVRADTGGLIENTTITGNTLAPAPLARFLPDQITGYGGGIDHRGGANLTIVNSTITDNYAYKAGGGINSGQDYLPIVPAGVWPFRVYLRNTIVADNKAGRIPGNCHVAGMVIESLGHNLSNDATCSLTASGDQPNTEAELAPVAMNGGPTETQALLPGSAAIGGATNCPSTDQRGFPRPVANCDIGAFQTQP